MTTFPARTIAIGDIHGCSLALSALLDAIRPRPDDTLVTLGDYINRGPDSRGVINVLIALTARCHLIPLLGNHDQMLLEARAGVHPMTWLGMGGIVTLDSYGPGHNLSLIPDAHFGFLEGCREFHETETHIFVHASYDPELPMDQQPGSKLRWESLRDSIPEPHASGKHVIAGHTSQKNGEILNLRHLTCIDTFCYGGGWLTAIDVHTREVWQANRDGVMRRG